MTRKPHVLIGQILKDRGCIDEEALQSALAHKRAHGVKLGEALLFLNLVSEEQLAASLREQGKIPCINLRPSIVDPAVAKDLGPERSKELVAMAVNRIAGITTVAMADPGDVYAVDELARQLQTPVMAVHAPPSRILDCIEEVFLSDGDRAAVRLDELVDQVGGLAGGLDLDQPPVEEEEEEAGLDQPVISLIRNVLEEAHGMGASDIHLEPRREGFLVRFRLDGALYERLSAPRSWARPAVSRVKVLAQLDIAQRRLPQDGRAQVRIRGKRVDLRIATTPTLVGEGAVIRILDGGREVPDLEAVNLAPRQLEDLRRMILCRNGFILTTGPTGSGKTTTLYALLKEITTPELKIITLEDPVENELPGVSQIATQPKIGLTFATGLRSILRQDPDVVLVGEVRDEETAQIAVQAALTGHLVLSTLHTVGTAETVVRLTEMGVEPYLLADTLRGILAQRLVRRICNHCRRPAEVQPELLEWLGLDPSEETRFQEGAGCTHCRGTGFKGRPGLFEVVQVTPELAEAVARGSTTAELRRVMAELEVVTLRGDGLRKARQGLTTLEEVLAVTSR